MQERIIKLTLEQLEGGADWMRAHKDTPLLDTPLWVLISLGVQAIQAEADAEQRWIPVSERLPEAGEYVGDVPKYYLVQNEYGDMLVARYTHSEYWEQIYQLKPYADKIVAWMPLPNSYKAESEE